MYRVKRSLSFVALLLGIVFLFLSGSHAAAVKRQSTSVSSTALVIAVSTDAADEAVSILNNFNQTNQVLVVEQTGTPLPTLETISGSSSVGNYGLIIVIGLASYDYATGWASAITSEQWSALYAYQLTYNVRMIHLDGYPGSFEGTALALEIENDDGWTVAAVNAGCCSSGDQSVYLLDSSLAPIESLSTIGLWHYPATITDFSTTTPFLEFGAISNEYPSPTVAGVTQNFGGREQMVFFIDGGSWSATTNYLGGVWFRWGYQISVADTALVVATDATAADEAVYILNNYNQSYQLLVVAQTGTPLPTLETVDASGNPVGNFGLIVVIGLTAYDYGGTTGWASAISSDQWSELYTYQLIYGVRMIHLDGYPNNFEGVTTSPNGPIGCCSSEEQYVYAVDTTLLSAGGLSTAATNLSTLWLWHYPAAITDPTTTTAVLDFAPNNEYNTTTVAGVFQNFSGREQMVFFLTGASWSSTTTYLGSIWFYWGYARLNSSAALAAIAPQTYPLNLFTEVYTGDCIPYKDSGAQDYLYGTNSGLEEDANFLCAQYCRKDLCKSLNLYSHHPWLSLFLHWDHEWRDDRSSIGSR